MFLKLMRLPIFIILVITFLFASCSEYQKVLQKDDMSKKYAFADSLYKEGKYKKALKLMEQLVPAYRGKPQAEKLTYLYADTYYQLKDYFSAGYQFERFVQAYPQSDSVEVAYFKSAKSFYNLSERYSLDQRQTHKAVEKLQGYINAYPNSPNREQANGYMIDLRTKLEKKEFEVARQYYRIESYKAAITAFDNFIAENPGTVYREEAYLYRIKAAYDLAVNSIPSLVEERLQEAQKYYNSYSKYYKDGKLSKDANEINDDITKRLAVINSDKITT